jgi:methylphosphotriester-DNA--protein-cysteine methyltransferase
VEYRRCRRCEPDIAMLTESSMGVFDDAKTMSQEV